MNNGIKNKLKELIGKRVNLIGYYGGISIVYSSDTSKYPYKVMRFEGEDCLVLSKDTEEHYLSIDYISHINIEG